MRIFPIARLKFYHEKMKIPIQWGRQRAEEKTSHGKVFSATFLEPARIHYLRDQFAIMNSSLNHETNPAAWGFKKQLSLGG
jgi:hypothetical protein